MFRVYCLVYCAVRPPSIKIAAPVIKLLASLARKTITPTISSGVAQRRNGIPLILYQIRTPKLFKVGLPQLVHQPHSPRHASGGSNVKSCNANGWSAFGWLLVTLLRLYVAIIRLKINVKDKIFCLRECCNLEESPDVAQSLGQIIASNFPFDVWYRERIQELHGVNLAGYEQFAQPTPLPQNQEVHFEWILNSSNPKKC